MAIYRKKVIFVDAVKFDGKNIDKLYEVLVGCGLIGVYTIGYNKLGSFHLFKNGFLVSRIDVGDQLVVYPEKVVGVVSNGVFEEEFEINN